MLSSTLSLSTLALLVGSTLLTFRLPIFFERRLRRSVPPEEILSERGLFVKTNGVQLSAPGWRKRTGRTWRLYGITSEKLVYERFYFTQWQARILFDILTEHGTHNGLVIYGIERVDPFG